MVFEIWNKEKSVCLSGDEACVSIGYKNAEATFNFESGAQRANFIEEQLLLLDDRTKLAVALHLVETITDKKGTLKPHQAANVLTFQVDGQQYVNIDENQWSFEEAGSECLLYLNYFKLAMEREGEILEEEKI